MINKKENRNVWREVVRLTREKGLARSDMARILGISETSLAFYADGRRKMNYEMAKTLEGVFGLPAEYWLERADVASEARKSAARAQRLVALYENYPIRKLYKMGHIGSEANPDIIERDLLEAPPKPEVHAEWEAKKRRRISDAKKRAASWGRHK